MKPGWKENVAKLLRLANEKKERPESIEAPGEKHL
jgi:hypothetical protein